MISKAFKSNLIGNSTCPCVSFAWSPQERPVGDKRRLGTPPYVSRPHLPTPALRLKRGALRCREEAYVALPACGAEAPYVLLAPLHSDYEHSTSVCVYIYARYPTRLLARPSSVTCIHSPSRDYPALPPCMLLVLLRERTVTFEGVRTDEGHERQICSMQML